MWEWQKIQKRTKADPSTGQRKDHISGQNQKIPNELIRGKEFKNR